MNNERAKESLFNRAIELQSTVNEFAADYMAEIERQSAQRERFRQMADALAELEKTRGLLNAAGQGVPDLLTAEAEQVADVLRRGGLLGGNFGPPGDCSEN